MEDREVGELWNRLPSFLGYRNGSIVVDYMSRLIEKLVDERAARLGQINPFFSEAFAQATRNALRDFGIDPTEWFLQHPKGE